MPVNVIDTLGAKNNGNFRLIKHERTEEDLTITMDPAADNPPEDLLLVDQAGVDAFGAFKNSDAAAASLPRRIRHVVTMSHVDGAHPLTTEFLGNDWRRFNWEIQPGSSQFLAGGIIMRSANGLVTTPTTSSMAVASGTVNGFVLASDPGFSADQYRGFMAEIVSGQGAGQVKSVRTHAGTIFDTAGDWSPFPNATSTIEIRNSAAWLTPNVAAPFPTLAMNGPQHFSPFFPALRFDSLDLIMPSSELQLSLVGASVVWSGGSRWVGVRMFVYDSQLAIDGVATFDGDGRAANFINLLNNSRLASAFGGGWLVRGFTGTPVRLVAGGGEVGVGAALQAIGGVIDGTSTYGIEANGKGANFVLGFQVTRGSGHTYGARLRNGAQYVYGTGFPALGLLTGGTDDTLIDTAPVSYATIGAAPNTTAIGGRNSQASEGGG